MDWSEYWDLHAQASPGFQENGQKKRKLVYENKGSILTYFKGPGCKHMQEFKRNTIYTINTLSHIKKAPHTAKYKAEAVVQ